MHKYLLLSLFGLGYLLSTTAQNKYAVQLIPVQLLQKANAVKRMEEIKIEIKDASNATITNKYAITILNASGEDAAEVQELYDQFINIQGINGSLYDAAGKKIKSLKKADINDYSGNDGFSLALDYRIKKHNFNWKNYPYTVEYEIVTVFKGIFYLPSWQPVADEDYSVEKSKLTVQCPLDYQLRFKTFNYAKAPIVTTDKKWMEYEWTVENILPIKSERYQPAWHEITPTVFLAPTNFEIQQYTGNMSDWIGYGKFSFTLNQNRDVLPANMQQKVHALTDGLKTAQEKIKVLYEYLQENTHYISIQLGIGGWQTFDANYVASKGYGDCKALSNYMYSLLKEVGIKAYYTLIKAGKNNKSFLPDFPSHQFNHVIICVPQGSDTTWLECTSQTLPMGYLSSFTCDRKALLVDETGGKLVHTPIYKKTDNTQLRKITATVNEEGQLTASIHTDYRAEQQDQLQGELSAYSNQKMGERLQTKLNLPSYNINQFNYTIQKDKLPVVTETIQLSANNYCAISGKRMFINPNILNLAATRLPNATTRKFSIKLPDAFTDIDSVEVYIPEGFTPESIPQNRIINNKFGLYRTSFKFTPNKIIYVRRVEQNMGIFPASDALALSEYFDAIILADREKIVFIKTGVPAPSK